MVVERPGARPRMLPSVASPPWRTPPATGTRRRAVVDYGFADAFERLYEGAGFSEAAE